MGSRRHRFDYAGIRFFLIDEYEPLPGGKEFQWRRRIRPEYLEWVREGLASWPPPRPVILAFHTPVLSWEKDDLWQESTSELLKMLSEHNILAIITGHIHRNLQWTLTMGEKKIRAINTGPLMGQQWTNLPPYYWFPIRPGYRLFCIQGEELHTFWRELGVELQASLIWVGDVHTGGPRPLVRPITIFSPVHLIAQGYEKGKDVHAMEWGLCKPCVSFHTVSWKVLWWQQMRRTFASALWSDWEAEFDPYEVESGDYMLVVRVRSDSMAYDGVPVKVCHRPSAVPAEAEPEQLFAFGLPHEKEEDRN
ncbi:MAG TPA: hypothetical protein EYP53_01710 [Candidatus Latescibacteria bacterium]|nr:hypothetical protein [Candidatus Latescibacterota bacterium]